MCVITGGDRIIAGIEYILPRKSYIYIHYKSIRDLERSSAAEPAAENLLTPLHSARTGKKIMAHINVHERRIRVRPHDSKHQISEDTNLFSHSRCPITLHKRPIASGAPHRKIKPSQASCKLSLLRAGPMITGNEKKKLKSKGNKL